MLDEIPPASGPNNPGAARRPIFATPTRTPLQSLLDDRDQRFFADHPDEQHRIRFYFLGERIEDEDDHGRHVIVTLQPDGTLTRRLQQGSGQV